MMNRIRRLNAENFRHGKWMENDEFRFSKIGTENRKKRLGNGEVKTRENTRLGYAVHQLRQSIEYRCVHRSSGFTFSFLQDCPLCTNESHKRKGLFGNNNKQNRCVVHRCVKWFHLYRWTSSE